MGDIWKINGASPFDSLFFLFFYSSDMEWNLTGYKRSQIRGCHGDHRSQSLWLFRGSCNRNILHRHIWLWWVSPRMVKSVQILFFLEFIWNHLKGAISPCIMLLEHDIQLFLFLFLILHIFNLWFSNLFLLLNHAFYVNIQTWLFLAF